MTAPAISPPIPDLGIADVLAYAEFLVDIAEAQARFRFSRTDFYRFRRKHHIETLPGRKVHLYDIVAGFEAERASVCRTRTSCSARLPGDVAGYAAKLFPIKEAQTTFGMGETTFWRFRLRHHIQTLSGGRVHVDDVLVGLEAERAGRRVA